MYFNKGSLSKDWASQMVLLVKKKKKKACQCRSLKKCGFNLWVWKIPWRRACQPTRVFSPGESHGQWSLVGYSPSGHKESDKTDRLTLSHILAYHLTFPLSRYLPKISENICPPKEDTLSSSHLFVVILTVILFSC